MSERELFIRRATEALSKGDVEQAKTIAEEAVVRWPDSAECRNVLGNVLVRAGKIEDAERAYRAAIELDPQLHKPYHNLGNLFSARGDSARACELYEEAIARSPSAYRSHAALGALLLEASRFDEAERAFRAAIEGAPSRTVFLGLAKALASKKDHRGAAEAFASARSLGASNLQECIAEADEWLKAGQIEGATPALEAAEQSLSALGEGKLADADGAEALKLARLEVEAGRDGVATDLVERFVLRSGLVEGPLSEHVALTWQLRALGDVRGAVDALDRAVKSAMKKKALADPEKVRKLEAAVDANPDQLALRILLVQHLIERGRVAEAERRITEYASYADTPLVGLLASVKMMQGHADEAIALRPRGVASGLLELHYSDSLTREEIFARHVEWGRTFEPPASPAPWPGGELRGRLRVGYISGDFFKHSVGRLILPILEHHDRDRFEVFAYMTGPANDDYTRHMQSLVTSFKRTWQLDAEGLDKLIRSDRIDVLVDLSGHSLHSRVPALSTKPAPIQVTYLGYPNTTGLPAIDYRITDPVSDPAGADELYVERLYRLPRPPWALSPARVPGLPERPEKGPVTFGCFNNANKLSKASIRAFSEIVNQVPGSRLLLKAAAFRDTATVETWRARFAEQGMNGERLELRGWDESDEAHLRRYGEVDLALDPFPYCGTLTTCEALMMGVPVISLAGDSHVSRVGVALLSCLGLDDLVARSRAEYVALAVGLATDHERRRALRSEVATRYERSNIADPLGLTRALEAAYLDMWKMGPR